MKKKSIVKKKKNNCKVTNNSKCLESFTKYCKENPSERFWQALLNWSLQYKKIDSIQIVKKLNMDEFDISAEFIHRDTYYITDEEFLNK